MATTWTIYKHTNRINGKSYIGVTTQKPQYRWDHGKGYNGCPKMARAIKKYGWESFSHHIIGWATTEDVAIAEEAYQIEKHNSIKHGYNTLPISGGFATGNKNSVGRVPWNKGKPHSAETKQKISDSKKGRPSHRKGVTLSIETKQRISESKTGHKYQARGEQ